jgi:hypothetical protein
MAREEGGLILSESDADDYKVNAELLVNRVLEDEGLTRDLDDEAATLLVNWMVGKVEEIAARNDKQERAVEEVEALCRETREKVKRVAKESDQLAALRRELPIP